MQRSDTHTWRKDWAALLRNALLSVSILITGLLLQRYLQQEAGQRNARRHSQEMARMLQEQIIATPSGGAVHSLGVTNKRLMASISPSHIEQALAQLAINSFESMPEGGTLTVSLRRGEPDDRPVPNTPVVHTNPERLALLEVIDTGQGIAPENLPHVFDPFFTTKHDGSRRGMGLTTVYLIASSHNGWVNVIPHTGKRGSTVQIWLPLLDSR